MYYRNLVRWAVGPVLIAVLAGCGGGGGGLPPERPAGAVTGQAYDAPVRNADVSVFAYDGGSAGALLGSGITDDEGRFSISVSAPSQWVLVEVTGGAYTDEVTGKEVSLAPGQVLRRIARFESGQVVDVAVTPLTLLASGLADYLVEEGEPVTKAVADAHAEVSAIFGVDVAASQPRPVNQPRQGDEAAEPDDGAVYGFLLSAFSSYSAELTTEAGTQDTGLAGIDLAQLMYRDMRADGILDGLAYDSEGVEVVTLTFGQVALDRQIYLGGLAQHMLVVANGTVNHTGWTAVDLQSRAEQLAPAALDVEGPQIEPSFAVGGYYSGAPVFVAQVADESGISSVAFDVDGQQTILADDPAAPAVAIDTMAFDDGAHQIGVRAVDSRGNETYGRFSVTFDNTPPKITITSPVITNRTDYLLTGEYDGTFAVVTDIAVNGQAADIRGDGTWQVPLQLERGENRLAISYTDKAGNTAPAPLQRTVRVDTREPTFTESASDVEFADPGGSTGSLLDATADGTAVVLLRRNTSLPQGESPEDAYPASQLSIWGIAYYQLVVFDQADARVFTQADNLVVQTRYALDGAELRPWTTIAGTLGASSELNTYTVPLTVETLAPEFIEARSQAVHDLGIRIIDEAGNVREKHYQFRAVFR